MPRNHVRNHSGQLGLLVGTVFARRPMWSRPSHFPRSSQRYSSMGLKVFTKFDFRKRLTSRSQTLIFAIRTSKVRPLSTLSSTGCHPWFHFFSERDSV